MKILLSKIHLNDKVYQPPKTLKHFVKKQIGGKTVYYEAEEHDHGNNAVGEMRLGETFAAMWGGVTALSSHLLDRPATLVYQPLAVGEEERSEDRCEAV